MRTLTICVKETAPAPAETTAPAEGTITVDAVRNVPRVEAPLRSQRPDAMQLDASTSCRALPMWPIEWQNAMGASVITAAAESFGGLRSPVNHSNETWRAWNNRGH